VTKFTLTFSLSSFVCSVAPWNVPYSRMHPKKSDICLHPYSEDLFWLLYIRQIIIYLLTPPIFIDQRIFTSAPTKAVPMAYGGLKRITAYSLSEPIFLQPAVGCEV